MSETTKHHHSAGHRCRPQTGILDLLAEWDPRVSTLRVGDKQAPAVVARDLQRTAVGPIDSLVDVTGAVDAPVALLGGIQALRRRGACALVGGVTGTLALAYLDIVRHELTVRGSYMYERTVPARLLARLGARTQLLDGVRPARFPLNEVDAAVQVAGELRGPHFACLTP